MTDSASSKRTASDAALAFLKEGGLPLEMRVARSFRTAGADVEQGRHYVDVETGKLRESDVYAKFTRGAGGMRPGLLEVRVVIECKRSDLPWLLLIGDERFYRSGPHFETLEMVKLGGADLAEVMAANDAPLVAYVGPLAYQVVTASSTKESHAYDAIRQVMSAVAGLKRDLVDPATYTGDVPALSVFVPVVVTSAPLLECRMDSAGEIQLTPVDRGLLVTRLTLDERLHSVWVVNNDAVDQFAAMAQSSTTRLNLAR